MNVLKVLGKLLVGNTYCVSVEGDIQSLKNGLKLIDEKGNEFEIKTVAMPHYRVIEDFRHCAELVLSGDVENIGEVLYSNAIWINVWKKEGKYGVAQKLSDISGAAVDTPDCGEEAIYKIEEIGEDA